MAGLMRIRPAQGWARGLDRAPAGPEDGGGGGGHGEQKSQNGCGRSGAPKPAIFA